MAEYGCVKNNLVKSTIVAVSLTKKVHQNAGYLHLKETNDKRCSYINEGKYTIHLDPMGDVFSRLIHLEGSNTPGCQSWLQFLAVQVTSQTTIEPPLFLARVFSGEQ